VADDWSEVRLKIPLNWQTHNYVGTIFGGSLYGAIDPIFMLMLIKILGPEYLIWDKSAKIDFKRPGRTTLYATFRLSGEEIESIKQELEMQRSLNRFYTVDLVDHRGRVHTSFEKTLYIRKKKSLTANSGPACFERSRSG